MGCKATGTGYENGILRKCWLLFFFIAITYFTWAYCSGTSQALSSGASKVFVLIRVELVNFCRHWSKQRLPGVEHNQIIVCSIPLS